ncbi:SGNH/GDSL hydrolase family protein [Mycobacteroides chelonae]|uniref:SGNH/GDSL hydrolase family protein n=1 Tax=Mycobacteroides chelonae TaxID=1774 RepID=UPI0009927EF9|nr:SGNH/GDSL hydrolase family protein [Mycobacteroides chelonae]
MVYRYVALGDSLSEGIGDTPWPDGRAMGWADRLAQKIATHRGEILYANLAVRGKRAEQVLAEQVESALALCPNLVTVTAGVNDILRPGARPDAVVDALDQIVRRLRARHTQVLLVCAPDLGALTFLGSLMSRRVTALNAGITAMVDSYGVYVPTLPAGSVFEDLRAWSPDRLHLSPLGHECLACCAASSLSIPGDQEWAQPPAGQAPKRGIVTEIHWAATYLMPWIGRRIRGVSSGDGRVAKLPELKYLQAR